MPQETFYKREKGEKVRCLACGHFCLIEEGKTGICGIRQNKGGRLELLVYGHPATIGIDPIEKKPLFHFLPGSQSYSLGTWGCNFACHNCQNFTLSQIYGYKGDLEKYRSLLGTSFFSSEDIVEEALKNNCQSIAYTYNEPTIWVEYALDIMRVAKRKGLKNVWVSNGFFSSHVLATIAPYLDAINIDIKSGENSFYQRYCEGRLAPVLNNCRQVKKKGIWLEVTTLVIPGYTDDEKMLEKLIYFIKDELGPDTPWHISAFSGAISWRMQHVPDTDKTVLEKIYSLAKKAGLHYVYTGNVYPGEEDTYCPSCGRVLIKRVGYSVESFLEKDSCACGQKISGVFN